MLDERRIVAEVDIAQPSVRKYPMEESGPPRYGRSCGHGAAEYSLPRGSLRIVIDPLAPPRTWPRPAHRPQTLPQGGVRIYEQALPK